MRNPTLINCPKCHRPLPSSLFNAPEYSQCPACDLPVKLTVFPALYKPLGSGSAGEYVVMDDEASCFYHPHKKAVVPCDNCGRFLCALCDVELHNQHLCPNCLETGQKKGKLQQLDKERVLYDNIALRVAVYPVLLLVFWFVTIITAPAAIVVSIKHWNTPSSILPRTKIRFILAILIAAVQIGAWLYVILAIRLL